MIPRTLYGRLSLALLAILVVLSLVGVGLILFSTQGYVREVSQRLNLDLATHLVPAEPLIEAGEVNEELLADRFHWMMVVNPSIELYLLDPAGRILAYSAPDDRVKREAVDLEPVRRFLAGPDKLPILGDDPRSVDGRKVFSAAEIRNDGRLDGYLYVVLGSELYDSAAGRVQRSYILRLALGALAVSLLTALAAGLLLFGWATRRLRRLTAAVDRFAASDLEGEVGFPERYDPSSGDEIDRLGARFGAMARRILEQLERLRDEDRQRRELVASVSHDLRTPLAALQGYLETLVLKQDSLTAEEKSHYLEVAGRHAERLGGLIADLFELSKLDSYRTPVHAEPFPLGELVQDVVQKFQLAAGERDVELVAEVSGEVPLVHADIGLIERLLENLIDNALRHTPRGGRVSVTPERDGERVAVRVADTGCGIESEDLPRVFDRFYRTRNGSGEGGSGLGLAIARRIVELHGGTIGAASRPGTGTTFTFELATVPRG